MDKATALLHASRGSMGDQNSLLAALRAALLGDGMATYAGNPTSNVTPANLGEYLFDTTNLVFYRATTTANTGWAVVAYPGTTAEEYSSLDLSAVSELFDDFLGSVVSNSWNRTKGTDATATVQIGVDLSGLCRVQTGATLTNALAINGSQLSGELNFQANKGGLAFEARVKPGTTGDTVTNMQIFIGFTNQTTTLQMPMNLTTGAATITALATDAVGFMFNDLATTSAKDWFMGGSKASTATAATAVGARPTGGTFQTLRIEVSTAGTATFYVDGVVKATIANAVTANVPLTPVVVVNSLTNTAKKVDVDYLKTRQVR
jgi:hypothetical protein